MMEAASGDSYAPVWCIRIFA